MKPEQIAELSRLMAPLIVVAQAEAWREGWAAHFREMERQRLDPRHPITANNPYGTEGVGQ